MSTSLLYHRFGARSYRHMRTEYREGATFFHARKKKGRRPCCRSCQGRMHLHAWKSYTLRTLPIGSQPSYLVAHLRQWRCPQCGRLEQEPRQVAEPRKSYTRVFARYVLELCERMSLSDVAEHLGVGWDLVKSILKSSLEARARRRRWTRVRRIGIDEVAIKKRHRYLSVVVDLDSGHVLFVGKGNDHEALKPFFDKLRRGRHKLEAIAMDMGAGYRKAVALYAPDVAVVYDPFHVIQRMNAALDALRRAEWRKLQGKQERKVMKGSRYLLLMGRERLHQVYPDRVAELDELLQANQTLNMAYLLKETLRLCWKQADKLTASFYLLEWAEQARSLGVRPMTKMADFVVKHLDRIVAYYDHPITNGPLEGLNNKIKVLKRQGYGYRDEDFFALRVLFLHETAFKLSGS